MIAYLIGVDGGGTGTRVRLARADGTELAQGYSGPSGLAHGIAEAWAAVDTAVARAFFDAGIAPAPTASAAIGLGLAGVHNRQWAAQFTAVDHGYAALHLDSDSATTLIGAHQGRPGVMVAIGTGSVGRARLADGSEREVGGWGFPSGDEAGGGWIGLRAVNHLQQVVDGRRPAGAFAQALHTACGGDRDAIQAWLAQAGQTAYASLAPLVVFHAADPFAHAILADAAREVAAMAAALDPSGTLPLALCGGLGAPLRPFLPPDLLARSVAPLGDAASGALRMIAAHMTRA